MPVIISCFEDVFVPVPSSSTTFCRFKTKKEFEEGVIQHIFTDGIIQIETRGTTQTRQVFVKHKVVTPMLSDFEMASIGGSSKSTCTTERTKACQNNCARILLLTHPTHASDASESCIRFRATEGFVIGNKVLVYEGSGENKTVGGSRKAVLMAMFRDQTAHVVYIHGGDVGAPPFFFPRLFACRAEGASLLDEKSLRNNPLNRKCLTVLSRTWLLSLNETAPTASTSHADSRSRCQPFCPCTTGIPCSLFHIFQAVIFGADGWSSSMTCPLWACTRLARVRGSISCL